MLVQTELSNMLVKKNVLNETKKIHARFQGLQENLKESILKFTQPSKLADKVKCSSQLRESVPTLYEFLFSLNPGDKPNDAHA